MFTHRRFIFSRWNSAAEKHGEFAKCKHRSLYAVSQLPYETAQCNNFQSWHFVQLLHFKEGLFSAAEIARSSNNVHPCTLFDSEFWLKPKYRSCYNHRHPQAVVNGEFACRKLAHCMPFLSFLTKRHNATTSKVDTLFSCCILKCYLCDAWTRRPIRKRKFPNRSTDELLKMRCF